MIRLNRKEIMFSQFPNGETKFNEVQVDEALGDFSNEIDFKYENDSDLIKLMFLKKYLDLRYVLNLVNLNIFYMPYSRMDRSENGSAFTLKYVSEFINNLNFNHVVIVEPHSNVTTALIDNSSSWMINEELIDEVAKLQQLDFEFDYIMYPDMGAANRYKNLKYSNVLVGNKKRDFKTGEIKGLELSGELNTGSKRVLIVDDLSSYGGTFVHSSKLLKQNGIEKVYLLVAHAENSVFKGELFDHIEHLYTTNSLITEQDHLENAKFKNQITVFEI